MVDHAVNCELELANMFVYRPCVYRPWLRVAGLASRPFAAVAMWECGAWRCVMNSRLCFGYWHLPVGPARYTVLKQQHQSMLCQDTEHHSSIMMMDQRLATVALPRGYLPAYNLFAKVLCCFSKPWVYCASLICWHTGKCDRCAVAGRSFC